MALAFVGAAFVHALFDFLLFMDLTPLFFFFFILIVQFWIIVINNCMNNSEHFDYRTALRAESSRFFITAALTSVFALEYI